MLRQLHGFWETRAKNIQEQKVFVARKCLVRTFNKKNIPLHFKTEAKTLVRILSKKMNMFLLDRTKTNSSSLNNDSKRGTCLTTNYWGTDRWKNRAISKIRTHDPLIKRRSLCRCATLADLLSFCSQENVWGWTEQSGDDVTDFSENDVSVRFLRSGKKHLYSKKPTWLSQLEANWKLCSWALFYKTLRITEKEKIYGSIFSVTLSTKIKEHFSFKWGFKDGKIYLWYCTPLIFSFSVNKKSMKFSSRGPWSSIAHLAKTQLLIGEILNFYKRSSTGFAT